MVVNRGAEAKCFTLQECRRKKNSRTSINNLDLGKNRDTDAAET